MKRNAQHGFTLMELLIAMTLLGMLAAGIMIALRVSLNAMEKADSRLMANRKVAAVERILEQQVAGIMPVLADCAPDGAPPIAFFQGEPQTMRFVSSYSIQEGSRGHARILEYQVIPNDRGEGVRLVVNEVLYSGPHSTGTICRVAPDAGGVPVPRFVAVRTGPASFVLADNLAYCRFSFRELPIDPPAARWLPVWKDPRLLPNAVRIEMAPLVPDVAKLQWLTLTMPIHVTREPLTQYAN